MRANLHITPSLIRRRYDQGLDSIVRLIADLEERIEDLTAMRITAPQQLIRSQMTQIKRLEQTFANKDTEMVAVHRINHQLQMRVRELEKCIENSSAAAEPPLLRRSICRG
jgi:phage shock protein A